MSKRRVVLPEAGRQLITRVTGFQLGQEYFDTCAEYVGHHLFDVNGMGGVQNKAMDHGVIDKRVYGLAEKLSMKGQDSKGEALKGYQERLRGLARSVGGGDHARTVATNSEADKEEAAQNVVSSILLLLLELSETPTISRKGEYGYAIPQALRPTKAPKTQQEINKELWASILKDDPLVGDHWRQVRLESVVLEGESSDSDFEDMDINPRAVPILSASNPSSASKKHDGDKDARLDPLIWMRKDVPRSHTCSTMTLEQQQYWQDGHIVSRQPVRTVSQQTADYNIQFASDLNSVLQISRDYVLAHSIPVMEEVDIIHEVFFLLQGLPTTIFVLAQDGSFKMSPNITTSHLSPGAVSAVVQPFQDAATVIRMLQTLSDRICSASSKMHGKVIQTFASAIQLELIEFKKYMASVQRKYHRQLAEPTRSMVSIIQLESTLAERFGLTRMLLDFVKERSFYNESSIGSGRACIHSVDVLSHLYDAVKQLELSGSTLASAMFQRLLQQAISPFLLNMERWLVGQPLDSNSEFMIKLSPNVDLFSTEFWSSGHQIEAEIVVDDGKTNKPDTSTAQISPCFVSDLSLQRLLYAGKAMQIILALKSFEASIPAATGFATAVSRRMFEDGGSGFINCSDGTSTSTWSLEQDFPGFSNILGDQYPLMPLPPLVNNVARTDVLLDNSAVVGYTWRMESELAKAIQDQYMQINSLLKALLFSQSRLKWHLNGMSEFFFMMQGEAMHLFAASVFSKMKRKRPWLDSYTLESTFHQVATLTDWKYAKFVKIRVGEGKRPWTDLMRLKAQTLELIEFDYMLPWPLGGIFYSTDSSKRMYSRITGLLFQIQIVKFTIEQSYFLKSKPAPSPEIPIFWKLRMRFLSTMNDLWSYFMMTVLSVQIQKFQSEIEGQGDLDDMIRLSQRFINVCYERCFLKERTLPLHRSLMTMLNLTLEFSALFSRFITDHAEEDGTRLKDMDPARQRIGHSGRRVSFNTTPVISRVAQKHAPLRSTGDTTSDSDDEQGWDDDQEQHGSEADLEYEDIDMDPGESSSSVKKQRVDSNSGRFLRERSFHRREYRRTDASRKVSQGGVVGGSYRESLEAIEQEFNRCREFLAKSLRVVVSSNAARGFAARRGGGQSPDQDTRGEGDSDYLDGLILALSS
ncbi:hypothetical protein EC991_001879 [Linnemannia zychae]|nr:hypothetical protein EC991_001879 [Linnemannia zychae]